MTGARPDWSPSVWALHVSNDEDMHRKMSRQTIRWIKDLAGSLPE